MKRRDFLKSALTGLVTYNLGSKAHAEDGPTYIASLGSSNYQMKEGTKELRVTLSEAPEGGNLSISYECNPLGDTSPDEIFPPKGKLVFPEGIKERYISVTAKQDNEHEADEQFEVRLNSNRKDVGFDINRAIITIKGDAISFSGSEAPRCGCSENKKDYLENVRKFLTYFIK